VLLVEEVQVAAVVLHPLLHRVVDVVDLPVLLLRPRKINLMNNIIKIKNFYNN
jgi:hypothetical protein